eukprot:TRINITY_DN2154_c4_g1_i1.p1 TRINITY_DN2154_c4_g1~~TRINITY_DN2154_c4_g1_i1.p1  ORF type:complete len:920 (+),score=288.82 TRINITY_DN2154_c4_g1_i1:65-2761(+)
MSSASSSDTDDESVERPDANTEIRLQAAAILKRGTACPVDDEESAAVLERYGGLVQLAGDPASRARLGGLFQSLRTVFLDDGKEREGSNMEHNIQRIGSFLRIGEHLGTDWLPSPVEADSVRMDGLYRQFLSVSREIAKAKEEAAKKPAEEVSAVRGRRQKGQQPPPPPPPDPGEEWMKMWRESRVPRPADAEKKAQEQAPPIPVSPTLSMTSVQTTDTTRALASKLHRAGFVEVAARILKMKQGNERRLTVKGAARRPEPVNNKRAAARALLSEVGVIDKNVKVPQPGVPGFVGGPTLAGELTVEDFFAGWDAKLWEEIRLIALNTDLHPDLCTRELADHVLREAEAPWLRMRQELISLKDHVRELTEKLARTPHSPTSRHQPVSSQAKAFYSEEEMKHRREIADLHNERQYAEEALAEARTRARAATEEMRSRRAEERAIRERISQMKQQLQKPVAHTHSQTDTWEGGELIPMRSTPSAVGSHVREVRRARRRIEMVPGLEAVACIAACVASAAMCMPCPGCGSWVRRSLKLRIAERTAARKNEPPVERTAEGKDVVAVSLPLPSSRSRPLLTPAPPKDPPTRPSMSRQDSDRGWPQQPGLAADRGDESSASAMEDTPDALMHTIGSAGSGGGKRKRKKKKPKQEREPFVRQPRQSAVEAHGFVRHGTLRRGTVADAGPPDVIKQMCRWMRSVASLLRATVTAGRHRSIGGLLAPFIAPGELMRPAETLKEAITDIVLSALPEDDGGGGKRLQSVKPQENLRSAADKLRKELFKLVDGSKKAEGGEEPVPEVPLSPPPPMPANLRSAVAGLAQQLTGAPAADTEPSPPPDDELCIGEDEEGAAYDYEAFSGADDGGVPLELPALQHRRGQLHRAGGGGEEQAAEEEDDEDTVLPPL